MNDLRTAAQQALEALEAFLSDELRPYEAAKASAALRAALAQEPAPMPSFPPVPQRQRGCVVCGIGADGMSYGYVCSRSDCPTRVTCGGAV